MFIFHSSFLYVSVSVPEVDRRVSNVLGKALPPARLSGRTVQSLGREPFVLAETGLSPVPCPQKLRESRPLSPHINDKEVLAACITSVR